ncbi:hypothetical protein KSD_91040 [Ktedonobacter sp. SOSP1-85]|nr:hypothetical protein KSD_91040 [Ktedonobacter sp. SOSP1-85]
MLQKHEETYKEQSIAVLLLWLDSHVEQFCNECCLAETVPFAHTLHLSFPYHVYGLISLQGSPGRLERKETHSWFDQSFEKTVVLFNQVVEVFALPKFARLGDASFCLKFLESFGLRRVFVKGDDTRSHCMGGSERFREKALRSLGVTSSA